MADIAKQIYSKKNLLITGKPGIGKSTAVQQLVEILRSEDIEVEGFYTSEIRNEQGYREGFDIFSLADSGENRPLARIGKKKPTVGKYSVDLKSFEKIALPILRNLAYQKKPRIAVIDEIGKMEMFSKKFSQYVIQILNKKNIVVIATVPLRDIRGTTEMKSREDSDLVTVTMQNRNGIVDIMKQHVDECLETVTTR